MYIFQSFRNPNYFPTTPLTKQSIPVSRLTLIRALLTTGRVSLPWPWFKYYPYFHKLSSRSVVWLLGRAVWVLSTLRVGNGVLELDRFYSTLDSSEKRQIGYTIGMMITGVSARVHFQIPWLLHLDKAILEGLVHSPSLPADSLRWSRGDLIGLRPSGQWFVVEAKGSSFPSRSLAWYAKRQSGRLVLIDDPRRGPTRPHPWVSIVHLREAPLVNSWVDPELEDGFILPMSIEWFLGLYYARFATLLLERDADIETYRGEFAIRKFLIGRNTYIGIGLHLSILESFRQSVREDDGAPLVKAAFSFAENWNSRDSEASEDGGDIGADGVIVIDGCA